MLEPVKTLRRTARSSSRGRGQRHLLRGGEGELFALLGPSGCGKTTTLRIIGGFVEPDAGTVFIDGKDVTFAPPYRRPTNTVFQSYALFPHLRLGANVAFGLKMTGARRSEQDHRSSQALRMVGLGGLENRKISELSGGQQQRAALARALANGPSVLLLDEPLGALDLTLRRQMQDELVTLKRETNTTFIHVTHDQEEACAMADRIAVMDRGQIAQIDTPQMLYRNPRSTHVARFINLGTIVKGSTRRDGFHARLEASGIVLEGRVQPTIPQHSRLAAVLPRGRTRLSSGAPTGATNEIKGTVERAVFTGLNHELLVRSESGALLNVSAAADVFDVADKGRAVVLTWSPDDVLFVEDTDDPQQNSSPYEPSQAS
ncbi:ABC transporter ATP-binding protein (plasmid) [Sinorhizobium meliloti]